MVCDINFLAFSTNTVVARTPPPHIAVFTPGRVTVSFIIVKYLLCPPRKLSILDLGMLPVVLRLLIPPPPQELPAVRLRHPIAPVPLDPALLLVAPQMDQPVAPRKPHHLPATKDLQQALSPASPSELESLRLQPEFSSSCASENVTASGRQRPKTLLLGLLLPWIHPNRCNNRMLSVCLQADTKALHNRDFNPVNIRMVTRTHSLRSLLMLPPLLTRHLPPNPISRIKVLTTEPVVPLPTPSHPYRQQSVVAIITTMGTLTGAFIHRLPLPQQFRKSMEIRGDRTCNHNLPRFMVQR